MCSHVTARAIVDSWLRTGTTLIVLTFLPFSIASPAGTDQQERDIRGKVKDAMALLPNDPQAAVAQLRSLGTSALDYIAEAIQLQPNLTQLQKALLLAVLADNKDEKGDAALIGLLSATDPFIRGSAVSALGRRQYKGAIPFFVKLLDDKETYITRSRTDPYSDESILVRDAAIEALETTTKMILAEKASSDKKANAWRRWWQKQQKAKRPASV